MLSDYLYGRIILAIFMTVCAVLDLKYRKIVRPVFIIMLILSAGGYTWMILTGREILWVRILIGVAVGVFIAILSLVTRGSIGMGDAAFFGIMGLTMGCRTVLVFAGTLILCTLVSLVICIINLCRDGKIKNSAVPLLPEAWSVGMAVLFFGEKLGL